jgi:hypothetical protein
MKVESNGDVCPLGPVLVRHMRICPYGPNIASCSKYSFIIKSSSIILVIHNNMINEINHIVEHVTTCISRSHGYNHNQS